MNPRAETENLAEGLGRARWGDSEPMVRSLYPGAITHIRDEERKHLRGQVVMAPPAPLVDDLVPGYGGVRVGAMLEFDDAGLKAITLLPRWDEPRADLRGCLARLAERLRFGPVTERQEQEWRVGGARVELFLERDDFLLTIHRPTG